MCFVSQSNNKAGAVAPSSPKPSDESFGTKKARTSFGRGFFKLRGGKQTASAPNLGELHQTGLYSALLFVISSLRLFHCVSVSHHWPRCFSHACKDRSRSVSAPVLGTVEQSGLVGPAVWRLWMLQLDVCRDRADTSIWTFCLVLLWAFTQNHPVVSYPWHNKPSAMKLFNATCQLWSIFSFIVNEKISKWCVVVLN